MLVLSINGNNGLLYWIILKDFMSYLKHTIQFKVSTNY